MFGWSKRAWGSFAIVSLLSTAASAVTQPNGVVVPVLDAGVTTCADKNVEVCIDLAEGDPTLIDTRADALVIPETFQPTCQLTFTPIVKGGSISNVFGWYNVETSQLDPGRYLKPSLNELYGMFVSNGFQTGDQLAGQAVVLDLGVEAAAGRYRGGQIGFFVASSAAPLTIDPETRLMTGNQPTFMFHTQHELNTGSSQETPYYNVLTWESVAHENTFYFGWEDLPANSGSDNDFDDFVFSVSGVQCGGGGQPCDTEKPGVCAAGTLQCQKGVIQCVQTIPEGAEICNALDDDCNGEVDDGDLCEEGRVCHRGVCVPNCGVGEFRCPGASVCNSLGLCVEQACRDVECGAGLVCAAGECVDSCTGVVCPHGRVCRNGGCIDPCLGIECDQGFECVLGICSNCACSACDAGSVCHQNQCVEEGCEGQTCDAGSYCSAGTCVDNCDGAVCPDGQVCSDGECVADPAGPGDPGSGNGGTGIVINPGGPNGSGGSNGGDGERRKLVPSEPACGCKLPGSPTDSRAALLLVALAGLALRRARRS